MNEPRKTCPKCRSKLKYDRDGYDVLKFVVEGYGDDRNKIYKAICTRKGCSNARRKFEVKIRR